MSESEDDTEDWFERARSRRQRAEEGEREATEDDDAGDGSDGEGVDPDPEQVADDAGEPTGEDDARDPFGGPDAGGTGDDGSRGSGEAGSGDPFGGVGEDAGEDTGGDTGEDTGGDTGGDPFGGSEAGGGDAPFGEGPEEGEAPGAGDPGGGPGDPDGGEEDPFGADFGSALEDAPDPGGGPGTGGGGPAPDPGGEEFGFGAPEAGGGGEEFGFGGPEAGGGEEVGSGGGFGFGGGGGGGGTDFDEEEFESDIERIDLGIEGLDEMILGGVPKRSLITAIGGAGTGKTTFSLQFLNQAMRNDRNTVFISLEESRERILDTAEEKGWPFPEYEQQGRLAIVDMDPIEMANSLGSIQSELPTLIDEFDAERLVLDSVSLLEMMYDRSSKRRTEVFEFAQALKTVGVTTFVTSEVSDDNAYASRFGIIEYLADAVFVLQYVRPSDFRETRLAIEIQKIRDANHSRETKPYEITDDGIDVYRQANIF